VEGTLGQYDCDSAGIYLVETTDDVDNLLINDPENLYYVTQTTLSVDETRSIIARMKSKWPAISSPKKEDICYATQNRQDAIRELAKSCQLVLVVGSITSSNSNRLRELAERCGTKAYLIDDAREISPHWIDGIERVGITAGASAPEILVQEVVEYLKKSGGETISYLNSVEENIVFVLPSELR